MKNIAKRVTGSALAALAMSGCAAQGADIRPATAELTLSELPPEIRNQVHQELERRKRSTNFEVIGGVMRAKLLLTLECLGLPQAMADTVILIPSGSFVKDLPSVPVDKQHCVTDNFVDDAVNGVDCGYKAFPVEGGTVLFMVDCGPQLKPSPTDRDI